MAGERVELTLTAKDQAKAIIEAHRRGLEQLVIIQNKLNAAMDAGKSTTRLTNEYIKKAAALRELGKEAEKTTKQLENLEKQAQRAASTSAATSSGGGKFAGSGIAGMGMLGGVMRAFGLAASGYAVKQVAEWTASTAIIGAQVLDTEKSLDNLSRSYNVNGRAIVAEMQRTAHGSVVASDLMISVNRALMAQNPEVAKALPRVFEIARAASIPAARDVQYVYDSLITGILRGSYRLIDNADIYLNIGEAVEAYAQSLGKTSEELSLQERQLAILNAVLDQGMTIVKNVNISQASYKEALDSVKTAAVNAKQAVGEYLAVVLTSSGAADKAAEAANEYAHSVSRKTDIIRKVAELEKSYSQQSMATMQLSSPRQLAQARGFTGPDAPGGSFGAFVAGITLVEGATDRYGQQLVELATRIVDSENAMAQLGGQSTIWQDQFAGATDVAYQFSSAIQSITGSMTGLTGIMAQAGGMAGGIFSSPVVSGFASVNPNRKLTSDELRKESATAFSGLWDSVAKAAGGRATIEQIKAKYSELAPALQNALQNAVTAGDVDLAIQRYGANAGNAWSKGFTDKIEDNSGKIKAAYDKLSGDITDMLKGDAEVTATDLLATKIGKYTPKANENTRRLQDIVENGLEILKKHPEYQGQLGIPGEVMGNNDQLRYWASVELEKSKNLQRPQDINDEMFKQEWAARQQAEAERQATIAHLMQLTGAKGAQGALSVAQQAGIATPKEDAAAQAELWQKAFAGTDVSAITVVSWTEMFKKDQSKYEEIGTSLGSAIAGAMVKALTENIGTVRKDIASMIAPDVAVILAREKRGGGEI